MACNVTAKSGQSRGLEDALGATVKGKLEGKHWKKKTNSAFHNWKLISRNFSEVDSDLPQDIRDEALMCFEAAVSNRMAVGDAIQKVQKDVLSKCDERFKGQRYKGFIKFDFDTNVISITVSKNIFRRRKKNQQPLHIG